MIEKFCLKFGLGFQKDKYKEEFLNRFNEVHGKCFEYITGYETSESHITVRCKRCGDNLKRNARTFTRSQTVQCNNCLRIESERVKREEQERRKIEIERKLQKAREVKR